MDSLLIFFYQECGSITGSRQKSDHRQQTKSKISSLYKSYEGQEHVELVHQWKMVKEILNVQWMWEK